MFLSLRLVKLAMMRVLKEIYVIISSHLITPQQQVLSRLEESARNKTQASARVSKIRVSLEGTNGDATLVLTGTSPTHYGKCMAQEGVFPFIDMTLAKELGLEHLPKFQNRITVPERENS